MADPTNKSYDGIISWAKASDNDIKAKQLATARSITITNNGGTSVVATAGSFDGTGTATIKLKDPVAINITGNVTGNCSGSSGSCTGNSATASAVKASRTTYSGNRPLALTYIDGITTTTDVTKAVLYSNNFYANPNTGVLTATGGFNGNATSATKLATARTLSLTGAVNGSGSFDGSTNLSITTTSGIMVPVGAVLPFFGTDSILPVNFQKCSGQTLAKASYPELFAVFVSSGMVSSSATSFVVPDLRKRYLKGSTRNDSSGCIGSMLFESLPDITGTIDMRHDQRAAIEAFGETYLPTLTGAFSDSDKSRNQYGVVDAPATGGGHLGCIDFKASNSDPIYGWPSQYGDGGQSVIPYSCVVNWIIRVK